MPFLPNHVYIIASRGQFKNTNVVLDLVEAKSANGTQSHIWNQSNNKETFSQQWLIKEVNGHPGVYTLRNLRTGTYLDLSDGSNQNGTRIQGWASAAGGPYEKNQQWKIIANGSYFKLQNVASQTYIDIFEKNHTPGTKVHGWQPYPTESQDWVLRRVSRTGAEIREMLTKSPYIANTFQSYLQDGLYVVLPKSVGNEVFRKSGLGTSFKWRNEIFDCDDFAFVCKGEVAKWGATELLADGFAILWGVMFGSQGGKKHAYNFYLNENLDAIVFFEPQTGEEKAEIGYNGYFSVF